MRQATPFALALSAIAVQTSFGVEPSPPQTAKELWADFDPRTDPVDAKTVRQWRHDGVTFRYVTYHVGMFKKKSATMAAFYAFPDHAKGVPGLLHLHGGGQRAFLREVEYYARRGYACLSINWGGRVMEDAEADDPNTDWGAVDPTQRNVPGYFNLLPGKKYLDPHESPRNNNWYLLTLAARRGLTFLEQQPQVDPKRLGVYGHSMGGNLTMYVAGSDDRLKAAAPSVGGQGFRTLPWKLLPEHRPRQINGDGDLFRATLGFQSYAPQVKCPLLWLSSTNDFHQCMDDTYRTGALIPHDQVRYSFAPHLNHRFTPPCSITRPLWLDQHLKGGPKLPPTPQSLLVLKTRDRVPRLEVTPDTSLPVTRVQVMYSLDPDPQARFWRTAAAEARDGTWHARLPVMSVEQPLFAFANAYYELDPPQLPPHGGPCGQFAISSLLHTAEPADLAAAAAKATDTRSNVIDQFNNDWRDWYALNADNPHHWEYSTRKINDPKWQGRQRQRLALTVQTDKPNELVVVLTENFFRNYRGRQRQFAAAVKLAGGRDPQTITLSPGDFKTTEGIGQLASWAKLDLLTLRAYYDRGDQPLGSKQWQGPQPAFRRLEWVGDNGPPH